MQKQLIDFNGYFFYLSYYKNVTKKVLYKMLTHFSQQKIFKVYIYSLRLPFLLQVLQNKYRIKCYRGFKSKLLWHANSYTLKRKRKNIYTSPTFIKIIQELQKYLIFLIGIEVQKALNMTKLVERCPICPYVSHGPMDEE